MEVIPLQWISGIAGIVAVVVCTIYAYKLAKSGNRLGYALVIVALTFSVFYLSRPVIHYGYGQYDVTSGKYKGNPHFHPIWKFDHVH